MAPRMVAERLQEKYDSFRTMTARFAQITVIPMSSRSRTGGGTLLFVKPGRMRWDYTSPDRQVLLSDGEELVMYLEQSRQLIHTPARDYLQSDVTYAFFAGRGKILEDFEVSDAGFEVETIPGSWLIKLVPKTQHPHVNRIYLWADTNTFLISRLQIIDHFDTVTDISFSDVVLDGNEYNALPIDDATFTFTPPAGTEVIRQ